jgi:hypothetical protein
MIARVAIAAPIELAVKGLAGGRDHACAGLEAAIGEQDVGGDDDAGRPRRRRDPVVRRVERVRHDHPLDQRMLRHADAAVADHRDRHPVPEGDAIHLFLHRAGIGIDQDTQIRRSSTHSATPYSSLPVFTHPISRLGAVAIPG